jgi:enoyl-CoA hydratase/carnithine racemase
VARLVYIGAEDVESLVLTEVVGGLGVITLNRPHALNALSLEMIRELYAVLSGWASDAAIKGVLLKGSARLDERGQPKGTAHFCAGGDIRFMHEAALSGDLAIDDFFTEEYTLDHFIHTCPKPVVAWMEGIVMGGGMGLVQGAALRVATESVRLAMPETRIGLVPDVAGGYFLSRCAGSAGEYLGVVGPSLHVTDALTLGLADVHAQAASLPALLQGFHDQPVATAQEVLPRVKAHVAAHALPTLPDATVTAHLDDINRHFSLHTMAEIEASLKASADGGDEWARQTLAHMAGNSPLMMCVTLEQIRRGRSMSLAQVFRMERDIVRQCFSLRKGRESETAEGIRALVIDKDHQPKWRPATIAEVDMADVEAFFQPPWPVAMHPLRHLVP